MTFDSTEKEKNTKTPITLIKKTSRSTFSVLSWRVFDVSLCLVVAVSLCCWQRMKMAVLVLLTCESPFVREWFGLTWTEVIWGRQQNLERLLCVDWGKVSGTRKGFYFVVLCSWNRFRSGLQVLPPYVMPNVVWPKRRHYAVSTLEVERLTVCPRFNRSLSTAMCNFNRWCLFLCSVLSWVAAGAVVLGWHQYNKYVEEEKTAQANGQILSAEEQAQWNAKIVPVEKQKSATKWTRK